MALVFSGYERYVEFCSLFSPVLVAQLLMPTWNAANGYADGHPLGAVLALLPRLPLSAATLGEHCVYNRDAFRSGRYWNAVTYMFLHRDAAHLLDNASGLIQAGPATVDALGKWGAVVTYFGAGVVAALDPPKLSAYQLERYLSMPYYFLRHAVDEAYASCVEPFLDDNLSDLVLSVTEYLLPRIEEYSYAAGTTVLLRRQNTQQLYDWMHSRYDDASRLLSTSIAARVDRSRRLIGASGGVSAFLAIDACAASEIVLTAVLRLLFGCGGGGGGGKGGVATSDDADGLATTRQPVDGLSVVHAGYHAFGILRYFAAELCRTYAGGEVFGDVDHSAHLNGMVVGVAAFLLTRAYRSWRRHQSSRRPTNHHNNNKRDDPPQVSQPAE